MHTAKRINQRVTAWIAIFAILCHALMPAVAQARAAFPDDGVAEICTSSGLREVAMDHGKPVPSPLKKFHTPHCAFCIAAGMLAPPPSHKSVFADVHTGTFTVPLVSTPHVNSRKLAAAQPRGPPSFLA
jgi:hypothetical protein